MECNEIVRTAITAAYKSANILKGFFGTDFRIDLKGARDLVTEADVQSEKAIIGTIRDRFPDHAVLSEESGREEGDNDYLWVIDPLDGTTNFSQNLDIFATSIAFVVKGRPVAGVVLNPARDELYTAVKGEGADRNGKPIRVSEKKRVSDSFIVTGFSYNYKDIFEELIRRFSACLLEARGVRRLGCASLDLCYVACGIFDGFFEQHLKPWDTAAGWLIATEAGGNVTDFSNHPYFLDKTEILATNGGIHEEMTSILKIRE